MKITKREIEMLERIAELQNKVIRDQGRIDQIEGEIVDIRDGEGFDEQFGEMVSYLSVLAALTEGQYESMSEIVYLQEKLRSADEPLDADRTGSVMNGILTAASKKEGN